MPLPITCFYYPSRTMLRLQRTPTSAVWNAASRQPSAMSPCIALSPREVLAHGRGDMRAERLDGFHELGMRQRRCVHLKGDARDAAQ